ncbi:MAG: hypothetical protein JWR75_1235 [Devosia sp.]|nr:hypothetical protein [Devosia sp.]
MIKAIPALALTAALMLGTATTSFAQEDIIDASMGKEITKIAKGFGKAKLEEDSRGDPMISGEVDKTLYTIYFYGCDEETHEGCTSLSFYAGFTWDEASAEVANQWNYDKRYGKAFVADDEGPGMKGDAKEAYIALQWDVDLTSGVTRDNMDAVIDTWVTNLGLFNDFLAENT